ncbi:MAG: ribosome silencing factor [Deltaproteobacteria bacterium]|nr:ribosome silencing factor [Deltaproteobacteria bacterium]
MEGGALTPKKLATLVVEAAQDTKALDLVVLDLSKLTSFTDYFVICSGRSDTQVRSIADNKQKKLNANSRYPLGMEGYKKGWWVLLDFGDVVAHIFYHETRDYYNLEKLWSDAVITRHS